MGYIYHFVHGHFTGTRPEYQSLSASFLIQNNRSKIGWHLVKTKSKREIVVTISTVNRNATNGNTGIPTENN